MIPGHPTGWTRRSQRMRAEGVKVVISELDVDVLPRRARGADVAAREQGGADPYRQGLPAEVAEAQARFYAPAFPRRPETPPSGDARHLLGYA